MVTFIALGSKVRTSNYIFMTLEWQGIIFEIIISCYGMASHKREIIKAGFHRLLDRQ
jgi:hypothetical protein